MAKTATKLATEGLNPELTEPYNACGLIPLDKNPGVRAIGIGEVMRSIIGNNNQMPKKPTIYQLCPGQKFGIEYAIHMLRDQ